MQKIVIDARMILSSGIGVYLQENINRLAKLEGALLTLLVTDKDVLHVKRLLNNVQVEIVSVPYNKYSLRSFFMLSRYIDKCDILWVPHITPFVTFFKKSKPQILYTIHDVNTIYFGLLKKISYWLMALLSCIFADRIIVVSNCTKAQIGQLFLNIFAKKITLIYPGIPDRRLSDDLNMLSPEISNYINSDYALIVGNIKRHKNIKMVAEVFVDDTMQLDSKMKLLIAGKIDDKYGFNLKNKYTDSDVTFLGEVTNEDLDILYKNCKIFIFPSLAEGFGLPLLEAMFYEKKIICSDIPVFREIAENSVIFFNPQSKVDLIKQIKAVLINKETNNYKNIIAKFNWDKSVKDLMKLFNI